MVKNRVYRDYKDLPLIYINDKQYAPFDSFTFIYPIDFIISHKGKLYVRPLSLKELGYKKPQKVIKREEPKKPVHCLCWLSECNCQFQRHKGPLTFCESYEIWKLCTNKEDINDGYEFLEV